MIRAVHIGWLAATGLGLLYAIVVGGVGGIEHLGQQARADWPWLTLILAGFGTQIGLFVELRRRNRLSRAVGATSGAGGGAAAVGMAACCAHHVADLVPLIGVSGLAVFLTSYRIPVMVAAITVNALGVLIALRKIRRTAFPPTSQEVTPPTSQEVPQCHAPS